MSNPGTDRGRDPGRSLATGRPEMNSTEGWVGRFEKSAVVVDG